LTPAKPRSFLDFDSILTGGQKMNIKSLLIGSAAAFVAVSGARAADAVVVAEPEPAEYVRICDVYGAGYYYIPGTETCLKVGGYIRIDFRGGNQGFEDVLDKEDALAGITTNFNDTYNTFARAQISLDARSETEFGTLRSYIAVNVEKNKRRITRAADGTVGPFDDWTSSSNTAYIDHAYISLGGLTVGYSDSMFESLTGSAGNVMADDIVNYTPGKSTRIAYTFDAGNGFSATLGVEELDGDFALDSYTPNVVAGAAFTQGWGSVSGVVAYDANFGEVAGKLRVDVNVNDQLSLFVMGGLADGDKINAYNTWGGDWAVWGGGTFKVNEKVAINAQLSYADQAFDESTFAAVVGVDYNIVPGFVIRPEVAYSKVEHADDTSDDGWGGRIRFQRNF
jgi:hypothetical protein